MITVPTYWDVPPITGYKPVTNYWEQLNQVEKDNKTSENACCLAIRKWLTETLEKAQKDYKAYTELVMILNHKCWAHAHFNQNQIGRLYSDLFYKTQDWGYKNLKGEELHYFINTLD